MSQLRPCHPPDWGTPPILQATSFHEALNGLIPVHLLPSSPNQEGQDTTSALVTHF